MQKTQSAPVHQTHLFSFLGLPRIPTNVNDNFIQPYTPNHKYVHWNRLNKLVYFLQVLWFLVDWRPLSGKARPETLFFNQIRVPLVDHDI